MATKIVTKNSSTASAVPTASDLVQGELAVNVADKRLFTEDNGGSIVELGTNPSTIDINAGTIDGTTIGASSASTGAFTTLTATGAFTSRGIDDNADAIAITIDSSENVGIGTSSPTEKLHVEGNVRLTDTSSIQFGSSKYQTLTGQAGSNDLLYRTYANHIFKTATGPNDNTDGTERMRIDSSGDLIVGGTSSGANDAVSISNTGYIQAIVNGDTVGYFNRRTSDGEILRFQKDGAAVGSIGTYEGTTVVTGKYTGLKFNYSNATNSIIHTVSPSGVARDAVDDLGYSGSRFKDLYLSGNALATAFVSSVDTDTFINMTGSNIIKFYGGGAERMRIDSSGNVGIGTSSPSNDLHVSGTGDRNIAVESTNTGAGANAGIKILAADGGDFLWQTGNATGNALRLYDLNASQERMRIDSSGLLKIGTSSTVAPYSLSKFAIDTGTYAFMDLLSTGSSGINFGDAGGAQRGSIEYNHGSDYLRFGTAGSERMRIDSSGRAYFSHDGAVSAFGSHTGVISTTAQAGYQCFTAHNTATSGTRYFGYFLVNGGSGNEVGSITSTGSSTAYNTTSDYRLKEDDVPMTGATDRVKALRPVNFAWKADGSRVDGFFAHELAEVVPEATTGSKDAMKDEEYEVTPAVLDDDGNVVTEAVMGTRSVPDYQGIDQSKLVPLLTAALQEAITKIESLTDRIAALEE